MSIPPLYFPKLPKPESVYEFTLTLNQIVLIEIALERLEAGIYRNLSTLGSEQLKQQAHEEITNLLLLRALFLNQLNRQTYKEMWGLYPEEDKR